MDGLGGLGFGCGRVGCLLGCVFRLGGRHTPGRNVGGFVEDEDEVVVVIVDVDVVVVVSVVVVGGGSGPEGTRGSRESECVRELMVNCSWLSGLQLGLGSC